MFAPPLRSAIAAALLGCAAAIVVAPAQGAPTPGAIGKADGLVAGPHAIPGGGTAWAEMTESGWRVRTAGVGGDKPMTVARGRVYTEEADDESGDFSQTSLGNVAFAGDRVLVEERSHAGSAKYHQYENTSTVSSFPLSGLGAATGLASCSGHEDSFSGSPLGSVSTPMAELSSDGTVAAVSICDKTDIFEGSSTKPIKTLEQSAVSAIAGDYVAQFTYDQDAKGYRYSVANWRTGAELYRTPAVADTSHPSRVGIQADGSLAILTRPSYEFASCTGTLTWNTAAAPAGVTLTTQACSTNPAVAGGEIAVGVEPGPGAGRRLMLFRGDGSQREVAWLGSAQSPLSAFELVDGAAFYGLLGCNDTWLLARADGTATPRPTSCADLTVTRARRSGRTLELRVRLDPAATGDLKVTYRVAGRTFRTTVTPVGGRVSKKLHLPSWAKRHTGITTVTYAGDATFLRQVDFR